MTTPPCMGNAPCMGNVPCLGNNNAPMYYQPRRNRNPIPQGSTLLYIIFVIFTNAFIVYIFNITPSTLFNSPIFMLIMIFTILFFRTFDFRAFSSPQHNQQYRNDGNARHCQQTCNPSSSYVTKHEKVSIENCTINYSNQEEEGGEILKEINKVATITPNVEANERVIEMVSRNETKKQGETIEYSNKGEPLHQLEVDNNREALLCEEKRVPTQIYGRSKSCNNGGSVDVLVDDDTKKKMKKSWTKKVEEEDEGENEFDTMTNEELNRRVEEFIQKINRQIRLQANAKNIYQV